MHICVCLCMCVCLCVYSLHSGKLNLETTDLLFYIFYHLSQLYFLPISLWILSIPSKEPHRGLIALPYSGLQQVRILTVHAFQCLFTCNTIIPAILHKSPWTIIAEILSLSQQIWEYCEFGACVSLAKYFQQFQAWSAKFFLSWFLPLWSQEICPSHPQFRGTLESKGC